MRGALYLLCISMALVAQSASASTPNPPSAVKSARLLKSDSATIRSGAATQLAEMGDAAIGARPAILAAMSDADANVRRECAWALGATGPPQADILQALDSALSDPDLLVRVYAATALIKLQPASATTNLPIVLDGLKADDVQGRSLTLVALGRLGPVAAEALPSLLALLDLPPDVLDKTLVMSVMQDLASGPWPSAIPRLVELLDDTNPYTRSQAAVLLVRMGRGDARVVPALLTKVRDTESRGRLSVLHALGALELPHSDLVPLLIKALRDSEAGVRMQAATQLGGYKPAENRVIQALVATLADKHFQVVAAARESLLAIGSPAGEALVKALHDAKPEMRREACRTIAKLGEYDSAIPELVLRLDDEDASVRDVAMISLGTYGAAAAKQAAPRLEAMVEDADLAIRTRAAVTLTQLGRIPRESVRVLLAAKRSSVGMDLQHAAAASLKSIRGAQIRRLMEYLDSDDESLRAGAFRVLSTEQDAAAVQAVKTVLQQACDSGQGLPAEIKTAMSNLLATPWSSPSERLVSALKDANPALRDDLVSLLREVDHTHARQAVLALLDVLRSKRPPRFAWHTVARLGSRSEEALSILMTVALEDPSEELRAGAINALGAIATEVEPDLKRASGGIGQCAEGILGTILATLDDSSEKVSETAALVLCRIKPPTHEVLPALINFVSGSSVNGRRAAISVIMDIGPAASPALLVLLEALKSENPKVRGQAALALASVAPDSEQIAQQLVGMLNSPENGGAPAEALSKMMPAAAMPELIACLNSNDAELAEAARECLIYSGASWPQLIPTLEKLREHPSKATRKLAAATIRELRRSRHAEGALGALTVEDLLRSLTDDSEEVRQGAIDALDALGDGAADMVLAIGEQLQEPKGEARRRAAEALKAIGPRAITALPQLIAATRVDSPVLRPLVPAIAALAQLGPEANDQVVPALKRLLYENDDEACAAATIALSAIAPAEAKDGVPLLVIRLELVTEYKLSNTVEIAEALGRIGPDAKQAIPILAFVWSRSAVYREHQAAAEAMRRIVGDPSAATRSRRAAH